ncbi:DEAD-box ATP-dependent RNA helicase 58, chloroplastic-like protein [Drosera capensis]
MLEKHVFNLNAVKVLVVDEVDSIFSSASQDNVVHVHVNPIELIPTRIQHRYMTCPKDWRDQTSISLLQDAPKSAIIFVNEQSEKTKNTCDMNIVLLDEDMNFNSRAVSLADVRLKESFLIVATDLVARGLDLPETTHIYNYDLPKSAIHYLHRAGRTGSKPSAKSECIVTSIIVPGERFVLERFENELRFHAKVLVCYLLVISFNPVYLTRSSPVTPTTRESVARPPACAQELQEVMGSAAWRLAFSFLVTFGL